MCMCANLVGVPVRGDDWLAENLIRDGTQKAHVAHQVVVRLVVIVAFIVVLLVVPLLAGLALSGALEW